MRELLEVHKIELFGNPPVEERIKFFWLNGAEVAENSSAWVKVLDAARRGMAAANA